ncbi:MAG: hypothetical protein Q8N10_07735 [Phenylobacterium sp.]|uniref:hypothetical protein n=1 Tax=Phenylobacterium sp. TaxID=1871053 RepID=UPI002728FEE6|nr:hypothetical protein [Phenylobacterium sp.]MDO8913945.1 hypothetical protein [Phenylobacterium sp.]MDP3100372.1 hypothetical protein [Phenylobacterium sp.]HQT53814.1 hypothetical protein [Phenylobacterium sp.]
MQERYHVRNDGPDWEVYDKFTGETVAIATVQQAGLCYSDAVALAHMLNTRAQRAVLQ